MPGKPIKAPKGFLTLRQISEKAKKLGFRINPNTLAIHAREGKVSFSQKTPGASPGTMFPESKFREVLKAAAKSAIMPKGSYSKSGLQRLAKSMGLKINDRSIIAKFRAIKAGKEPMPQGLATDLFHGKHRYILPPALVKTLLREAELRKHLPRLLRSGKLVPVSEFAKSLGLKERSLYTNKSLLKIKIHQALYTTDKEAKRFGAEYLKQKNAGRRCPWVKPVKQPEREALEKQLIEYGKQLEAAGAGKPVAGKTRKRPARLQIPILPKELANTGTQLLAKIKAFEQKSLNAIVLLQRFPQGSETRVANERVLAGRANEWEQSVDAARRKLVKWRISKKATTGGLIEENNLEIAGKALKIVRLFLEGERETDNLVKAQRKGVEFLQFRNEALKAGEAQ